ncbi:MAG: hydantoinase B/oxoprolinase family protein [Phycisphaerae bacterium]
MGTACWRFAIDVGGTFTDVVARRPDGGVVMHKLLSSGAVRGVAGAGTTTDRIQDAARVGDPDGHWVGYTLAVVDGAGGVIAESEVVGFDGRAGMLRLVPALAVPADPPPHQDAAGTGVRFPVGCSYELRCAEPAPVVAIRYVMGVRLGDPIGVVDVRLGTTRATNALLERSGARTALIATKGLGDMLTIGDQDRPKLFELNIHKRDELAERVVEIDERIDARGNVLRAPDAAVVRRQLAALAADGVEAVAVCLLHAHVNPAHEDLVAGIASRVGFAHVAVSSRVSRLQRIVPRGDTTVVDAYLGPVIERYVASIRRSLPHACLKLMTSTGGLVDASAVSGKDTVLSGPAGGVVGCAHVSRRAGADKVIAFDMGGTSTDVSRVDGPFAYTHETVKAGVRIMTPMLAVETVAAGGGSVCAFDGQKLTVGPGSAGADPGPACYGRGGPATLTDMNVVLGRIPPACFPFRLDVAASRRVVDALCDDVNRATGSALTRAALAEGCVRIANANMAAAIRRISVAKGYDLRGYALACFGGAGGQHACAIARALSMSRVLISRFAGVLSAVGIGVAAMKRIGERSVEIDVRDAVRGALAPLFESIRADLACKLAAEGVGPDERATPVRTIDLAYAGEVGLITIDAEPLASMRARFERRHQTVYGYVHDGRAVVVRTVRVELTARDDDADAWTSVDAAPQAPVPRAKAYDASGSAAPRARCGRYGEVDAVFDGVSSRVGVHARDELAIGARLTGPAIVIDATSTTVVAPGWRLCVMPTGDLELTDVQGPAAREAVSADVDPVQLELFHNQFAAIAEQMGETLRRTSLSTNVKERLDFSCAVFTPSGDLVANAPHIPVHLGGMSDCVKALIEDVPHLAPGDVYITNDPYRGGSHLNDVTVVTPVHDAAGERLMFFVASRAHHAEIGGSRPGSMPPDSTSLADEGVLITAMPWLVDGRPQDAALRRRLSRGRYPSRAVDDNVADIVAQVAANRRGVCDLLAMVERYGVDVVHAYMAHIQTAAERKMRAALARLPDGVHRFEDTLDDGSAIRLAVTIDGDRATFDFSGTGGVLPGNLNANPSIVRSAVLYCLRCLIDDDIPLNGGVLQPVTIHLPVCLLNPPRDDDPARCPAVAGGNVETSQRVVDCVLGALGVVAAAQGTMNNLLVGDATFGYYETICGGAGAGPGFHGADAVHTHMTNTRLTDPEVLESRYPVRVVRFAVRRGSGGAGRFRGGDGVVRELAFLAPLDVSIISQRRTTAPYGVSGGAPGAPGRNRLHRAGADTADVLPGIAQVRVGPGDHLTIETPGGGGYGAVT